ncbi:hypothetical protein GCM10025772_20660 [Ferrimonas gelatinilytica]|uniref:Uncharacterized protein n=1 Tax=Ferrimonas gelatinilytica TaxID=1255257 RepID=A0ABP9S7T0_9GAMM
MIATLFFGLTAVPAQANKPEWAGKGKPPTQEQKEAHKEAMRSKRGNEVEKLEPEPRPTLRERLDERTKEAEREADRRARDTHDSREMTGRETRSRERLEQRTEETEREADRRARDTHDSREMMGRETHSREVRGAEVGKGTR